jgi:hypothetical protein
MRVFSHRKRTCQHRSRLAHADEEDKSFFSGELLVLALVRKYKQEGTAFVPRFLDLLASGGSDAPHRLLAKLGVKVPVELPRTNLFSVDALRRLMAQSS